MDFQEWHVLAQKTARAAGQIRLSPHHVETRVFHPAGP